MLQEIQVRGGVKKRPHPSGGGVDFFWNNPMETRAIASLAYNQYAAHNYA